MSQTPRPGLRLFLTVCCALLASSCVSFGGDVSSDAALWGGYARGVEYQLLKDVFILRVDDGLLSHKLVLVPAAVPRRRLGRHYSSPISVEAYRQDPQAAIDAGGGAAQKLDVVGIVPAGTRLKCSELRHRAGWTFMTGHFEDLTPYAKILDGAFAGTLVDIMDVSIYYREHSGEVFRYRPEEGVIAAAPP